MKPRLQLLLAGFFLLLPWIFFDIDLGDQSYHSLGSWLMAFHPKMPEGELPYWFEQVPVWFSYFVDSLWWRVVGPDATLLSLRFGWIFFQLLVLLGLFEGYSRLFPEKNPVPALLFGLMAVNTAADQFVLSYYMVPPAFGALAFLFLVLGIKEGRGWSLGAAGLFAALAVQSRLPSAAPILAGAALMLLADGLWKKDIRIFFRNAAGFGLGFFLGTFLALVCLFAAGQGSYFLPGTRGFWESVTGATNQRYSGGLVLERAVGHYLRIAVGFLLFAPVAVLLILFPRIRKLLLTAAFISVVMLAVAKYGVALAMVIGGAGAVFLFQLWQERQRLQSWQLALLLGSGSCLVAFTLGTYLEGIQTFKYGLWLLVPSALLVSSDRELRIWLGTVVVALFLTTRILWPTFPYLERPIFRMNSSFGIPALAGLRTYPEKSRTLRELTEKLAEFGLAPGTELLVYAGVPTYYPVAGVYLLTRTIPLLHDPGLVEYPGGRWLKHKRALQILAGRRQLPPLIVRQKEALPRMELTPQNLLRGVWSYSGQGIAPRPFSWTNGMENGLAGEMDEILRGAEYRAVWENDFFVILSRAAFP